MSATERPDENAVEQTLSPAARATRIQQECTGCWAQYNVSQKSRDFLDGIKKRAPASMSEKQEKWMRDIEMSVFGKTDEEEEDASHRALDGRPSFGRKK